MAAWLNEPNEMDWDDPLTGYPCMLRRNNVGAWCGYVGLSKGHPWFGVGYGDLDPYPTVHGGVTFADHWSTDDPRWWIGFDCCHYTDIAPAVRTFREGKVYRDMDYATAETVNLAMQAKYVFVNALKSSVHGA